MTTKPTTAQQDNSTPTDVAQLIDDLDAGMLKRALSIAISQAAAGAVDHSENGKVVLELVFKPIEHTTQVHCEHTLKFTRPTQDGRSIEEQTRKTTLYVGRHGRVTLLPPQVDLHGQVHISATGG